MRRHACRSAQPLGGLVPLLAPNSSAPFIPTPAYLLGVFDVYDREETMGEELGLFDPNTPGDLKRLLDGWFFLAWSEAHGYTIQHRWEFAKSVADALERPGFDFAATFCNNDDEGFYPPYKWNITDARLFYVRAYKLLIDRWSGEWRGKLSELPEPNRFDSDA
jgi:hypothetical protein